MFQNLIRRISYSIIPRPDRPWADDATSNAPQKRKRRLSNSEQDSDEEGSKKKLRSVTSTPVDESKPIFPQLETKEVKEVTAGVKEVDLVDKSTTSVAPEAVPLPEDDTSESDEGTPEATKPEEQVEADTKADAAPKVETTTADAEVTPEDNSVTTDAATADQPEDSEVPAPTATTEVDDSEAISVPTPSTALTNDTQPTTQDTPSETVDVSSPKKD